ncbi:MAG: hypothetical protein MRY64_17035 [Hyphomonadaceae bacterium]|nr:hypothetical protein [Hyphomonadaceae bacterium]
MSLVPMDVPQPYRREGPVVTVLGSDKNLDLSTAEPSPYMVKGQRIWRLAKGVAKAGAMLAVIAAYPTLMWSAHDVNDDPVEAVTAETWASPATGVAITLVAREVEGPGWTADKPVFSPARQLTAQPAWQDAIADSLAEYFQLAAGTVTRDSEIDPDLAAASRLLRTKANTDMTPRLIAAAEALARFNGRVHAGLIEDLDADADLAQSLRLYSGWAAASSDELASLIGHSNGWPASRADVHAYYTARARAHVASSLLQAAVHTHPELMQRASLRAQLYETQAVWARIASQDPLVVSNQDGDGAILPNHLAAMAWHLDQAETASVQLAELILGTQPADMTLAGADTVVLTSSP